MQTADRHERLQHIDSSLLRASRWQRAVDDPRHTGYRSLPRDGDVQPFLRPQRLGGLQRKGTARGGDTTHRKRGTCHYIIRTVGIKGEAK